MSSSMIRMPLKLRLGKKSGRYELSQDIYVLSIYVGDFLLLQCTLTSDSTAQQCIAFLREKIDLSQVQFFALRYHMKCNDPDRRMMRWVEMDKPLRKQLEKWACKPRQVQLAILFHTPNVFALSDPTARSLFYKLLKLDATHGKFVTDLDKYISLAAYSMQVEYGDYNAEVHTKSFLRTLPLLPPHLYRSSQMVDDFLMRILAVYERLTGMQPSYAAFLYIVDAQQCEGYGEEFFNAKDDESTEVQIGYSQESLVVKRCHSSALKYRWQDIKDIVAVKRVLHVKCKAEANNAIFTMEDAEMARYVAMVLRWQFDYAVTDAIQHKAVPMSISNLQGAIRIFGERPTPSRTSDMYSTKAKSFDMASMTASMTSATNIYCTPSSSSSVSRFAPCMARNAPVLHAVQSFQHNVNSGVALATRPRAATSASTQLLNNSVSTPSLVQNVHPAYTKQSAIYRPSITRQDAQTADGVVPQLFESRLFERQMLKEMANQRNGQQKTMGSSPEIHTVGVGNLSKHGNSHLMRRAQSNARGFRTDQRAQNLSDDKSEPASHPTHALSTPDLNLKWTSTPDLIGTSVNQLALLRQHQQQQIQQQQAYAPYTARTNAAESGPSVAPALNGSGKLATKKLAMSTPSVIPNGVFSQGHVISANRLHGQAIVYPVPRLDQPGTSAEPPTYVQALNQQQHFDRHFYHLNSLPQSSVGSTASTDSYMRRLNDAEPESEVDILERATNSRSPSPQDSDERSTSRGMHSRHVLLNGVARSGSLAAHQQRQIQQRQLRRGSSDDETLNMLRDKLNTAQAIDAEFAAIPAKRLSAGVSTSQHPENQPRNRQGNVFPYEDTRVMLTPTAANADGYVNASNVQVPVGDRTVAYIVCQAPMKSTTDDFWHMIWESGASLIVMLVNPHQTDKNDSVPPYWPTKAKEKLVLNDYLLKMQSTTTTKFQTTSVLSLKCARTGERRTIYHLYCADFVADGVPSSEAAFLGFIDAVSSIKRLIENDRAKETDSGVFSLLQGKGRSREDGRGNLTDVTNRTRSQSTESGGWKRKLRLAPSASPLPTPKMERGSASHNSSRLSDTSDASNSTNSSNSPADEVLKPPTVVHCTDGASESGVYLLVESLIQCIEHNVPVDVPSMLKSLRQQRMYLVRNVNQYRFVYSLLSSFLEQSRLI